MVTAGCCHQFCVKRLGRSGHASSQYDAASFSSRVYTQDLGCMLSHVMQSVRIQKCWQGPLLLKPCLHCLQTCNPLDHIKANHDELLAAGFVWDLFVFMYVARNGHVSIAERECQASRPTLAPGPCLLRSSSCHAVGQR